MVAKIINFANKLFGADINFIDTGYCAFGIGWASSCVTGHWSLAAGGFVLGAFSQMPEARGQRPEAITWIVYSLVIYYETSLCISSGNSQVSGIALRVST
jgi:hypothetical protein